MNKKYLLSGLTAALLFLGCSGSDNQQQGNRFSESGVIPAVEAVQAQYGALPLVERFSGNVVAENQVELYPEVSAQISEVFVENGDMVTKGQALVKLQDEPFRKQLLQAEAGLKINQARLKQAEAQLAELQARYRRISTLAEKDLSSELEMEQISAQVISAEADVDLAKAQVDQSTALVEERRNQLSKTLITAPVAGTIGQRNARVGMQAGPGNPLFMIGDLSKLRIEIVLTENMLNRISVGQSASVLLDGGEGNMINMEAKVSRISPFLNEITRSTDAEIDFDNSSGLLKPGMYVPVDVYFGESQQATLIPTSALFIDPITGNEGIYVAGSIGSEIEPVSDSTSESGPGSMTAPTEVTFQEINVIARGKMEVAVSGLESGKWVVTLGQDMLAEGRTQARVKTISWEHVIELQQLQSEDLLDEVMRKQAQAAAANSVSL